MKISLITPCYNSVRTLPTALESVRAQKGAEVEYIVMDGGSSDGTVELLSKFAETFPCRWSSEPDRGMYDAINKGIALATGDVVGTLNADDMLDSPDSLAKVAAAFEDGVDAVYSDVRFVADDLETTLRHYGARHWRPWMLRWGKMPPHPSLYLRRALFERLGAYKLDYDIAADYELIIRYLRRAAVPSRYVDATLVKMRMGGKSTRGWRSNLKLNQEIVRGNRENGYFCCLPMLAPKYLFKIFEFILPRLGAGRRKSATQKEEGTR